MKKIIIFFLMLLPLILCAQAPEIMWSQTYGGTVYDHLYSVQQTFDGGFILTGGTLSYGAGSWDVWLVKTNDLGNEEWSQTFGGSEGDSGDSVIQTNDGGYAVCGVTSSFSGNSEHNALLIKFDENGILQWYEVYTFSTYPSQVCSIYQTSDEGYLLGGSYSGLGSTGIGIKTDLNGIQEWTTNISGSRGANSMYDFKQTSDGGYILCGVKCIYWDSLNDDLEFYVRKSDSNNELEWEYFAPSNEYDDERAYSIQETSDNGFIVAGVDNNNDLLIVKLDANGISQWDVAFEGYGTSENSNKIIETSDGGYAIVSWGDVTILKLDLNGNIEYEFQCSDANGYSIAESTDGNIVVCGEESGFSSLTKVNNGFVVDFNAEQTSGHFPLEVEFVDLSFGTPTSWEWDFDNDGTIDSFEQNPTWVYTNPGVYSVSLSVNDGGNSSTKIKTDYITVVDTPTLINIPDDYLTIQEGINATIDGDTVLVQPGTYFENINFNDKNITVGSLFLTTQDTTYISQTIIDGGQLDRVVTFESNEDTLAVLTGFTITNGYAQGVTYDGRGGGISCQNSSPKLEYLNIINNTAITYGGGIYFQNSNSILQYSVIRQNSSIGIQQQERSGGGINSSFSEVYINDVTICWNEAYEGGGLRSDDSNLIIKNSDIHHNIANHNGGGLYLTDNPLIENTLIHDNSASGDGGGIWLISSPTLSKLTIFNNIADNGAGLFIFYQNANPTLTNVTITSNIANLGGGICLKDGPPQANLLNSIVYYNLPEQICLSNCSDDALITIEYSDIEGGEAGIVAGYPQQISWLSGNIEDNPLFVDNNNSDYCLLPSSPCIDAGNPDPQYNDPDDTRNDMGSHYFDQNISYPSFYGYPSSGSHPLNVDFFDASTGTPISWEWDFDNNGIIDSYSQNPSYTYLQEGCFSVRLSVSDGINSNTLVKENYITVTDYWHVTTEGSDIYGTGTELNPYATIQHAINTIPEGDTILVHPGTYYENIDFIGKAITVASMFIVTQDSSFIDQTIINGGQNGHVVTMENNEDFNTLLCGFTITNGDFGIRISSSTNTNSPKIDHVNVINNDDCGMYISYSSPDITNSNVMNNISQADGGGIFLGNSNANITNVIISGNLATNNGGGGIFISNSDNVYLENLTITLNSVGTGDEGGGVYCHNSIVGMINCILWDNEAQEIYVPLGSVSATYSDIEGGWAGNGNINTNPLFIDAQNGNFNLTENSPCIDSGHPNIIYNDPDGTRNDMGAYYFYQFYCEFISDITSGVHPLEVNFTDNSYGILTSWEWDFENDGTIDSYVQNPAWVYEAPGIYTVSLTIGDGESFNTETKIDLITAINTDPVVQNPLGSLTMYEDIIDSTSINLNNFFSDPNGDELTYTYTGNDSISVEVLEDGRVVFTPNENWFGEDTIHFTADDLWETDSQPVDEKNDVPTKQEPNDTDRREKQTEEFDHPVFSNSRIDDSESDNRSSVTDSLVVTVESVNDEPWFTSTPIAAVMEDEIYSYTATAEDIENDALTFAAPILPAWLTFTPAIGLLTGIPTNNEVGDHNVTITVTDDIIQDPIEQSFVITVINLNNPPEINFPAEFQFLEDLSSTYDFTQYVTDIDNSYEELILTWEGNEIIDIVNDNWDVTFSSNTENWYGEEVVTFYVDDGVTRTRSQPVSKQSPRVFFEKSKKQLRSVEIESQRDIVSESISVFCISVNDPPELISWSPEELEFTVYQDSIVTFIVEAIDVDSEPSYNWFLNSILLEDEIDSLYFHTFDVVGYVDIGSLIYDEDYQIGQNWLIHVNEIVEAGDNIIPQVTKLHQNYPNPFNPVTNICLDIKENETGTLKIFNMKGQIVESKKFNSGKHVYTWNADKKCSGLYIYQLKTESRIHIRKMLLLK